MSLCDDFHMYYSGTFVGVVGRNSVIEPFYVDGVSYNPNIMDLDNEPMSRVYSDEAIQALTFTGTRYSGESRNTRTIPYADLVLEMPDSKYIKLGNSYHWVTYRSQKSTKKGLCSRRLTGVGNVNERVVYELFNGSDDNCIVANVFYINGDNLNYKGVPVGNINAARTEASLVHDAAHLKRFVEKEFGGCQVTVLAEQE
ncbi:hypothetical protein PQC38_gp040 [Aeromonas phage BUCT695]|uniref:hypothetical protein n=1 Tax=Aeromonas phage BUCT695 TaxID=2908630 RepID=UPI0023294CA1|nr:hypothetical protein PQC38_gp040 [Aeromonas phage BUCT695]UIW10516.1 hypothetical protein [Aeromonas phage BUCT695]